MPYVPILNVAMIEILMRLDDQSIENTYYAQNETGWSLGALEDLADAVLVWVGGSYFNLLSNMITCVGVKVTDLTTNTSPTFTAVPATTVQGAVAQPSVPSNVAFVIKHLTGSRGRSFRGRSFVPAIPVTSMADTNTVSSTFANNQRATFEDLDTIIEGLTAIPVVASRFSGGDERVAGLATQILTHAYTDLTVDSMRPRLPGRGN